jgi:5S rRNA maturation endonuclease (ribonuclease M5)
VTTETIAFNRMVDRLAELGIKTRFGGGKMRVIGICHDASDVGAVTFERGRNGGLVVWCHACEGNEKFLAAIGWTLADLHDEPLPERGRDNHGGGDDWVPCTPKGHRKVAEYRYVDERNELIHAATRCDHKCFAQWRPDPTAKSGRRWKLNDDQGNRLVRLVPYRLPQILSAITVEQVIWIAEGEKDVHALVDRGLEATCNAAGSGKWTAEHARHLHGADVTVVADRDEPGRRHAELVVETLRGVARSVYVVQARYGKDAFDHFAGGGTTGDFLQVWAPAPFPGDLIGASA